jgi:hypothetical protein
MVIKPQPPTAGPSRSDDVAIPVRQVVFVAVPLPGSTALASFGAPWQCHAVLADERLLRTEAAEQLNPARTPSLACMLLDSQIATRQQRKAAVAWLTAAPRNGARRLRLALKDDARVLLGGDRAVVLAPVELHAPALKALAEFRLYEHELRRLEHEIAADWERLSADMPLANDVKPEDLKRVDDLGSMTATVGQRRIRLARLELPLLKTQLHDLPPPALHLARALRSKFDLEQRLETLDGQLEVYEYTYEMANQRMGEYRNFRHEFLLEVLIVFLLAAELAVMLWDVFAGSKPY